MSSPKLASYGALLLVVGGLGACQRAAFQFQPSPGSALVAAPLLQPALPVAIARVQAAALVPTAAQHRRMHGPQRLARVARARVMSSLPELRHSVHNVAAPLSGAAMVAPQQPVPPIKPERRRSRAIAIVLGFLSITYVPLSLHNFYLGYYGRGAAAIALVLAGLFLIAIGWPGLLFGGSLTAVGYIGVGVLAAWFFWQLSDLIRIITNNLQPKNGSYSKKEG